MMKKFFAAGALLSTCLSGPITAAPVGDASQRRAQAHDVRITRDDWGIAHVRGERDADAVFGAKSCRVAP